jgi:uncharacterized protein (TIGR00106 family)
MQITVIPVGTASPSVGEFVARTQKVVEESGLAYELQDMGTVVEGGAGDLFRLAARIHEMPFAKGARRVVTQITVDDRRDREVAIGDKVASVRERLGITG